jgi:hypothetical protein
MVLTEDGWVRPERATRPVAAWVCADGTMLAVGGRAGDFSMSAPAVTVQAGQQIQVQMLQEEAIPGSMRVLVPAYPLPRSTNS